MTQKEALKLFNDRKVRTVWDDEKEKWYFSIVDVIAALTDSENPQVYWRVLKNRLLKEGNQTVTNCNGLKMAAPDGRMRLTDVARAARLELEANTGRKVVSPLNARAIRQKAIKKGGKESENE